MPDYQDQDTFRASRDDVRSSRPSGGSGGLLGSANIISMVLALIIMITLFLLWQQTSELKDLRQQFDELNGMIQSTDESLSQSGTALSLKIREQEETISKHWVEIKKLWGVSYDRNRKAIEANKKAAENARYIAQRTENALKKQVASNSQLKGKLENQDVVIQQTATTVKNLSSSALAVTLQIEELETRLDAIAGIQQDIASLSSRVKDTEGALKALDSYRSQVNQQLHQLRQKINQP